jgi:hypothetical protein
VKRCPVCNFEESLWAGLEDELAARVDRAIEQLHLTRLALDADGHAAAANVMSEAVWFLEAAEARIEVLLRSARP